MVVMNSMSRYASDFETFNRTNSQTFHSSLVNSVGSTSGGTCVSIEDVSEVLRYLNIHDHVDSFVENQIDGDMLTSIDETNLVQALGGLSRLQAKRLPMCVKEGWRPKTGIEQQGNASEEEKFELFTEEEEYKDAESDTIDIKL